VLSEDIWFFPKFVTMQLVFHTSTDFFVASFLKAFKSCGFGAFCICVGMNNCAAINEKQGGASLLNAASLKFVMQERANSFRLQLCFALQMWKRFYCVSLFVVCCCFVRAILFNFQCSVQFILARKLGGEKGEKESSFVFQA